MASSVAPTATDAAEAAHWLADEVERIRGLSYRDLTELAGTSQHREIRARSDRSLDLETQVAWDDDRHTVLYVTLNVWDRGTKGQVIPTEVVHDEFAFSPDGRGGVLGPIRRREAVEHSPVRRNNRRLVYGIFVAVGWAGWGWENAGAHHFSSDSTAFALAMSVLWFAAIVLTIWRWHKHRLQ